jgi:cobalt-zinc-cadmium efflux system protein
MSHDHSHAHDTSDDIKIAFFLNLGFTLVELFGGYWTNSLAILSDALHDLGDSISLGISWYLDRYSHRTKNRRYSYGYRRFSLLAALINTLILIAGSIVILSEAIPRIMHPEPTNARGMILFAIGGVLVNGLAALRMRGGQTLNAEVVTLHLLEDVLGWFAVLVVSVILLFAEVHVLDPILSLLIALWVLYNVVGSLRKTAALFLQSVPEGMDVNAIEAQLLDLERVESVHHTHLWSLDGEHHVLTTHIVVDGETTREEAIEIKCAAKALSDLAACEHATVEIEYPHESCTMRQT